MRGFKAFAFAATASVLLAGSLQAQSATDSVKWKGVGVNSVHSRYDIFSHTDKGPYGEDAFRSPYRAQFKMAGSATFGAEQDIFCVDFFHWSNTGTYSANFTSLGTTPDAFATLRTTRHSSLEDYMAAAWLADQIVMPNLTENTYRVLQATMWSIMSGVPMYWQTTSGSWVGGTFSTIYQDNYIPGQLSWISRARNGSQLMNASEWAVVTERDANGGLGAGQEYITRVQVTPEPATLLLLGTGLLATLMAAGALRRSAV